MQQAGGAEKQEQEAGEQGKGGCTLACNGIVAEKSLSSNRFLNIVVFVIYFIVF